MHSRCYYHSRTSSIITDRNLLDSEIVGGLLNLLPEEERYGLKYVTICLEDGLAGEVDRASLVAALEVFGQIRDSGVNPKDVFRGLKDQEVKIVPVVKARPLTAAAKVRNPAPSPRKHVRKPPVKNRGARQAKRNGTG
jgi:hypothetical protein